MLHRYIEDGAEHLSSAFAVQSASSIETIYKTSAFRDVIFASKPAVQQPLPPWEDGGVGLITVRFSIK